MATSIIVLIHLVGCVLKESIPVEEELKEENRMICPLLVI